MGKLCELYLPNVLARIGLLALLVDALEGLATSVPERAMLTVECRVDDVVLLLRPSRPLMSTVVLKSSLLSPLFMALSLPCQQMLVNLSRSSEVAYLLWTSCKAISVR